MLIIEGEIEIKFEKSKKKEYILCKDRRIWFDCNI